MIIGALFLSSCSTNYAICDDSYSNIIIKGKIDWTDYGKNVHPSFHAKVKIWNEELLCTRLIATAISDENGYYEVAIKNSHQYGKRGKGLYIEFGPETEHAIINTNGNEEYYKRYRITSDDLDGNVYEKSLTYGTDLCGRSYSIAQALEYGNQYVYELDGSHLPQLIINYPSGYKYPYETYFDYTKRQIHVAEINYYDWDVLLHEYGHYVEEMYGFASGAGGWHYMNEILTERFSQDIGERKAWNEGFATYFSLSCQKHLAMDRLGIADYDGVNTFANDSFDIKKYKDIDINVKNKWRYGDGCETSVAGFLLSLADSDLTTNDDFSYGFKALWDIIAPNKVVSMSEFIEHLYAIYPADIDRIEKLREYFKSGN